MKKLIICLATLLAGASTAWANFEEGAMNIEGTLLWKMPSSGGTLTIYGDDYVPMCNYTSVDDNLRMYALPEVQDIDMQKGVTIGNYAFAELENLEMVKLHGTSATVNPIVYIGNNAFAGSAKLVSINSEKLTDLRYIGANAFTGTGIKTFTINKPAGSELLHYTTTAGGFPVDLDREHCFIEENAFADCDHLTTVYMNDETPFTETYNNFLNDHTYLVVNNEATAIAYQEVWPEIANQVIYLQQNVPFEDETFKDICISNWDSNGDGELSYEEAFAVTTFGDVFKGNTSLKEIKFNDLKPFINVTIIGSGTFAGCTALEKITFPTHIEDIADDAFEGCINLKEIHFTAAYPFKPEFTIQINERTHIIVPDAYLSTYDATWVNKGELIIGESHIAFQCPIAKSLCVAKWDNNGDNELSFSEASGVYYIGNVFAGSKITAFDELKYFTGISVIGNGVYGNPGFDAFNECRFLKTLTIPSNVKSIGVSAFAECESLEKLVFMNGGNINIDYQYKSSNRYAAFFDSPLKEIYVGRTIIYESDYPPIKNQKIESLTIAPHVTDLSAFKLHGGIENCYIDDLKKWCSTDLKLSKNYGDFYNLYLKGKLLTDLEIPNTVTNIVNDAFSGCSSILSVTIPESVTSIGTSAFRYCFNLSSVVIGKNVKSVGSNAFSETPLVVFEHTEPISYANFSDLATYVVPDDVVDDYKNAWPGVAHRIVGKSAIEWKEVTCEAQATLPNLTEVIGAGNEGNIVKLRIKGSINSYDMMVMRNKMVNLRELDLTEATIVANTYDYGTGVSEDNVYPDFLKGKPITKLLLPTSITKIGNNALRDCSNIKSITIPANVLQIGEYAFYECQALSFVEMSENNQLQSIEKCAFSFNYDSKNERKSVLTFDLTQAKQLQTIGSQAFSSSLIEKIQFPSSLQTIRDGAFSYCKALTNIVISVDVSGNAFYYCTSLTDVVAHGNIGSSAFRGCTALTNVVVDGNIDSRAFEECKALRNITLGTKTASIGEYAFFQCSSLNDVILPETISQIGKSAFSLCSSLQSIKLPNALISLGTGAFASCSALEQAEICMGITSVPQNLFSNCHNLKNVKLSPKTTTIQSYAFNNCTGLKEFHLPPYLTTIQSDAFSGCSNLKNIYAYMPDVPAISTSTFTNYSTSNLYAPAFLWSAYYVDNGWNQFLKVLPCDLRPGDYEAFYTNKDLLFKEGEERITHDRPIVELGNQGAIIVEGAKQEFTSVDMERGSTSSSLIGDNNIPMDELRVKVAVTKNRWYFLSFPYDVEIVACTYPGKYAWREYDGAARAATGGTGWKNVEGTTLAAKKGYIFQSNTTGTLWVRFKNPTFGGDRPQELEAHHSDNAANASWNFVGNPYTSYYNITDEDFSSPITIWNGSSYVAYRPGDDDYHLQPFEAFFVQKPESTDEIAFNADGRETYRQSVAVKTTQTKARQAKGVRADRRIINLSISDNDTVALDRTRLVFNQQAQRAYEMECDAAKFLSDETLIQIYSLEDGIPMAINERPEEGDIRLGFVAKSKGTYSITAPRMDVPMTLVDNEKGVSFDLANGAYSFEAKKGTHNARFSLRFSNEATAILGITKDTGVAIGLQDGGLNLGGVDGQTVSIYGANGVLMSQSTTNGFVALPAGVYVVNVDGKSVKVSVK